MMVGKTEVPIPHRVSLHTTRPAYFKKRRVMFSPGQRMSRHFTRKPRLRIMCPAIINSSMIRASRVARAAPETPSLGAPRLPKMNTQFRKVFPSIETTRMHRPRFGFSMLR